MRRISSHGTGVATRVRSLLSPRRWAPSPVKSKTRPVPSFRAPRSRRRTSPPTRLAKEQSNEAGAYSFPAMPPGTYTVKAELQGFKTVQNTVELHVEQTLRLNFTLEVGALTETTEVTGVAPLITTENATVGTVIENRRIVELPLNGRNYLSLIALSPNVSAEFAGAGSGRRSPGRLARPAATLHLRPAPRVQLLHARRRRQHRRQLQHLHLPAVGRRARRVQGADRHLLGRVRPRRRPGERRHQVGLERVPRHGVRVPPQRRVRLAPLLLHRRAGRRSRKRRSNGISTATRPAGPILRNKLFFMSNFEGYKDRKTVPEQLHGAVGGDAGRRLLVGTGAAARSGARAPVDRRDPDTARRSRATAFRPTASIQSR